MTIVSDTPAPSPLVPLLSRVPRWFGRIPENFILLLGRFSISAVFWLSGETKVQNFSVNLVAGEFHLGWPRLSDSAVSLFQDEYKLPLVSPELAAPLAATAEHVFPVLILVGLATRLSALSLLIMTLVIEIFVFPDAYPTHGTWATILLLLMAKGAGRYSLDHWLVRHRALTPS